MTSATQTPLGQQTAMPQIAQQRVPPRADLPPAHRTPRQWSGYLFLLPYLTLFTVFLILPLFFGLGLSFMRYEMATTEPAAFIGLDNYREALYADRGNGVHGDPFFWKALKATALFVVMASPLTVTIALLLAVGVNSLPGRRQNAYQMMIFLPTMITISVVGILWRWLLSTEFGVFNAILEPFGMKVDWLTKPYLAMSSIVLMTLWWTIGGPMVILMAGLKQIPESYYEAAAIDGAVGWRRFFFITLPLLKPVLLFVVVMNVIGAFQVFGQPFIVTKGGPERSTFVLMQYVYETSFMHYRLGYGAAMSWLLFLLIAGFSVIQFRLMREQ